MKNFLKINFIIVYLVLMGTFISKQLKTFSGEQQYVNFRYALFSEGKAIYDGKTVYFNKWRSRVPREILFQQYHYDENKIRNWYLFKLYDIPLFISNTCLFMYMYIKRIKNPKIFTTVYIAITIMTFYVYDKYFNIEVRYESIQYIESTIMIISLYFISVIIGSLIYVYKYRQIKPID